MCYDSKETWMLRVSNRGDGVREIVPDTTYEVNLPSQLRGKQVKVEVINGLVVVDTESTDFPSLREVGVVASMGQLGFDAETQYDSNQFMSGSYTTLFDVNLQSFDIINGSKSAVSFHTATKYEFRVGSLPEKLTFSRYHVHEAEPALAAMVTGNLYKIISVGTTNFTLLGADSNTLGESFVYNGVTTSGSGKVLALHIKHLYREPRYLSFVLKITEV